MGSRASVLKLLRSYLKWYRKFYRSLINMNSVKIFLICAFAIFQIIEATDPDVAATAHEEAPNVDSYSAVASDVDPYAAYNAYYSAYGNQVSNDQSSGQYVSEKQSFGDEVEALIGPDAAIILGTLGAVMGTLAAVGVTLNTFNTNSICTTVKALGDTSLATTTAANLGSTGTYSTTVEGYIVARFNLIEAKINGYATPSC